MTRGGQAGGAPGVYAVRAQGGGDAAVQVGLDLLPTGMWPNGVASTRADSDGQALVNAKPHCDGTKVAEAGMGESFVVSTKASARSAQSHVDCP